MNKININRKNILGYGPALAPDHPGFHDIQYKNRRTKIARLANKYVADQSIKNVNYIKEEHQVWNTVITNLEDLYPKYACKEFNRGFDYLSFNKTEIPQLNDVSNLLYKHNGWRLVPVAGLLHPRDFLAGLANKQFHSTQYIRHHSQPMYTPEPDICHELIGHIPMLLNDNYANFIEQFGKISLNKNDKDLWNITKMYWYLIEFGVINEINIDNITEVKAFGAGILSSFGEMHHMINKNAKIIQLDESNLKFPKINYNGGFQDFYYVLNSFDDCELFKKLIM